MKKQMLVLCLVLLFSSSAFAQNANSDGATGDSALANTLNLCLHTMQVALNESRNRNSDLELIENQRDALEALEEEYGQMVQSLMKLEKTKGGMDQAVSLCLRKMDLFEKRLSSDILLPHQSTVRKMVFAELVKDHGGDLVATLSTYYPQQFTLDDAQKKQMKKITMSTKEKIAKAKHEFEEKLKRIATETETDVHDVFTPRQSEILAELSGRVRR